MSEPTSPQTFKCPNCGAPIEYDGKGETAIRCPYCGTSAPVPEDLLPASVRSSPASERMVVIPVMPMVAGTAAGGGCAIAGFAIAILVVIVAAVVGISIFTASQVSTRVSSVQQVVKTAVMQQVTLQAPTRTAAPTPTPRYANPVLKFGGQGIGAGKFKDARTIGVDGSGNIYVGEYTGGRVQVFDPNGKFITQWFAGNSKTYMLGLAVGHNGTVFVADGANITRFEGLTGKALGRLPYSGGPGFGELAAAPDGGLVAMWYERREGLFTSREGAREDMVRFDAQGKVTQVISAAVSSQTDSLELDNFPVVDGQGNVYIFASMSGSVFKFAPDGKFVTRIGSHGSQPDQFEAPNAIAVDSQGNVYLHDEGQVIVLGPEGRFIRKFAIDGVASGIAIDDKDALYTVGGNMVTKYELGQ